MTNPQPPRGFSPFTWAIAAFCVPILLWPLGLLVSTSLYKNPALSATQLEWLSHFFWLYPLGIAVVARLLFLLKKRHSRLANQLLALSAVIFYGLSFYVIHLGFN